VTIKVCGYLCGQGMSIDGYFYLFIFYRTCMYWIDVYQYQQSAVFEDGKNIIEPAASIN